MLLGNLDQPRSHQLLLQHRVWKKAFSWLEAHRDALPDDGEYEIEGHDLRAIVQTVTLRPRSKLLFEAHRREIDIQCCIFGSEVIDYAPVDTLNPRGEYDPKKDSTLYDGSLRATSIRMTRGSFAIFFPEEGHRPGITSYDSHTRKVVIKIDVGLLS